MFYDFIRYRKRIRWHPNFSNLTVRIKTSPWWFIRLWFLIESIICCGMCPFRLIPHCRRARSSMMHSIQDLFASCPSGRVFGFIDSHSHSIPHDVPSSLLSPHFAFSSHQLCSISDACSRSSIKKSSRGGIVNLRFFLSLLD